MDRITELLRQRFDIAPPERVVVQRLLLKNAPWNTIRQRIATGLQGAPLDLGAQAQTDQLMTIVLEAIHALTPKAKPSPYAKRWWTTDLTNLRRIYTSQRNQARSTAESEFSLSILSSGHVKLPRNTMMLFAARRKLTGRNFYRTI